MGRCSGVAIWLLWKHQATLQKWLRYNVSLWRLYMRCWNDVIFVTTSNVFIACNHIATSERRLLAMSQRRCNDVDLSTRGETTGTKMSTKTEVVKNYKYRSIYSQSCCKIQAFPDVILVLFTHFKASFRQDFIFAEILQKAKPVINLLINYVLFLLECFYTGSLKSHLSWGI